jgi:2'-5' RNA ligase
MAPVRDSNSQRVFFALWPDAPLQASLGELAREVAREGGGRPTAPHRIHLTLAFLGEQPTGRVEALRGLGSAIQAHAFALALNAVGGFPRTGVAWLGTSAPQPELEALHRELAAALRRSGFAIDERPFAPHLTLARSAARTLDRCLPQPLCWRVNSFVLAVSELAREGPSYRTLAEWPLTTV